jgi:hypothetical protein
VEPGFRERNCLKWNLFVMGCKVLQNRSGSRVLTLARLLSLCFTETVGVHNNCNIDSPTGQHQIANGVARIVGPGRLEVRSPPLMVLPKWTRIAHIFPSVTTGPLLSVLPLG